MSSRRGGRGGVEVGDREQVPHALRSSRTPSTPVDLLEQHQDLLVAGGRDVLADVVGADRQLPVAAVDEHGQLHGAGRPWSASASSAARTVRPDIRTSSTSTTSASSRPPSGTSVPSSGRGRAAAQVVAVERGVHRRRPRAAVPAELGDRGGQPAGQHGAAGGDADEDDALGARGLLDDLVRDARDGAGDVGGAEQLPVGRARPPVPAAVSATGLSFPASPDGLKGRTVRARTYQRPRVRARGAPAREHRRRTHRDPADPTPSGGALSHDRCCVRLRSRRT